MRFQGDYLDTATGLYHDGARYMDPTLGRFTQLDPSGQNADDTYAGDDPVNLQDPNGASPQPDKSCGGDVQVGAG